MAAISVTAASVIASTDDGDLGRGIAGTTITAGQALCKNDTTGKLELADANGASAYMKTVVGISCHAAETNQPVTYQKGWGSSMTFNSVLTAGAIYTAGGTPGGIHPVADLGSGITTSIIGIAPSATVLKLYILNSGIAG